MRTANSDFPIILTSNCTTGNQSSEMQSLVRIQTDLSCIMILAGFLPNCIIVYLLPSMRNILPMLKTKRLMSSKFAAVELSTRNPTRAGSTAKDKEKQSRNGTMK